MHGVPTWVAAAARSAEMARVYEVRTASGPCGPSGSGPASPMASSPTRPCGPSPALARGASLWGTSGRPFGVGAVASNGLSSSPWASFVGRRGLSLPCALSRAICFPGTADGLCRR